MDTYVDLAGEALWLILLLSFPPLLASLVVGVLISLLQALTQVQEQTLTFVPKIIATVLAIMVSATAVLDQLKAFSGKVFDVMLKVGSGS
ncbi:MAG: flagellar biosynthetic protein FliQ [Pyrinomonadaceae bacterium]|nr:flagellar biosynthetic protein FliQ [Pyrinomonadaceae bacterium]